VIFYTGCYKGECFVLTDLRKYGFPESSYTDNGSGTNNVDGINSTNITGDNTIIIMQVELTHELKQQEIVTTIIFNPETDNLSIALNHKYSEKKIISPVESTWPKTIATLTKELQRKKISAGHITMLCDVADNAADKILKLRRNRQAEKEKEEENNQKSRRLLPVSL
jgi:hypothetical protein